MSEIDDKKSANSKLDLMSTEELEESLKTYSQSSEDADMDYILTILEVIERREKLNPSGKYTDTDTAWVSFQKNYRPANQQAEPFYDFTGIKENHPSDNKKPKGIYVSNHGRRPIRHKVLLRTAFVFVLLIIMLLSSTMIAKAFGFDLWAAVAKWTKDTFGFSISVSDVQESQDPIEKMVYKSLQDALGNYNITSNLAPTWLPDGYLLQSVNVNETPIKTTFFANYNNEIGEITITIISFSNPITRTYEKDDRTVTEYTINGTQYYIMSNLDQTQIVWQIENFECSISGNYSLDDAKKIIESIYERNIQ